MRVSWVVLGLLVFVVLGACANSAYYSQKVAKAHPRVGDVVQVNGEDVHVIRRGETGPLVVMIHGASANAMEFEWTLAPRLSDAHRVLMVDRPGHGYSGRPAESETLEVQAGQIAGAVKALAPGDKAVVIGHSFGGAVALRLALDHPELVTALVLSAPVSHDWGGGGEAWYNSYAANPIIGPIFNQVVPFVGPAQVKSGIKNVFWPQPAPEGYYEKSAIGLLFRPFEFRANAEDVNALQVELAAQETRYGELSVPITVFSGSKDTVIKPPLHVGKLKHQTDVKLVKLDDEGHMPHHGQGAEMAAEIARLATSH